MSSQRIRAKAIAELEKKRGRVTATDLVSAARDKKHPLHSDFDWNDRTAAQKHRIERAREIIASVRVVVTTETQKITSVGYVRDPQSPPGTQGYVSVATLRNDVAYAQQALDAEVGRVVSSLERAREFAAVVGLQEELQLALESATQLHSRSRRGPPGRDIGDGSQIAA